MNFVKTDEKQEKAVFHHINTMSCLIKVNSNTIELTDHPSCYCILDLLFSKLHLRLTLC